MGYSKANAYRKIQRIEEGFLKREVGSGRPPIVAIDINNVKNQSIF